MDLQLTGSIKARINQSLKSKVARAYLQTTNLLIRRSLRHAGNRDFRQIKVVTAVQSRNGISNGACLQAATLKAQGYDIELLDSTVAFHRPLFKVDHAAGTAYVFHSGGPETPTLVRSALPHVREAYRIGYWAWELPTPPLDWPRASGLVSEVWTPSSFSRDALSRVCDVPIRIVPHRLRHQPPRPPRRSGPFTVLSLADGRSSLTRKNPLASVMAFQRAFGSSRDARLILKLSGKPASLVTFRRDLMDISRLENITILTDYLEAVEMRKLYDDADVLLSLHRAEGFGLPMLEAMTHGIPVVATGWSGNMDFMDSASACLVDHRLLPVADATCYAGYEKSLWAEPDIDCAASHIGRLFTDQSYYESKSHAGWTAASLHNNRLDDLGDKALSS